LTQDDEIHDHTGHNLATSKIILEEYEVNNIAMLRDTLLRSVGKSRLASWDRFACSRKRRVVHRVSFLLYTIASFIDSLIAELDKFQQNMEARIHEMKTQLSTMKARIENEDPYISLIERLAA
jgi:hypothetical protein